MISPEPILVIAGFSLLFKGLVMLVMVVAGLVVAWLVMS